MKKVSILIAAFFAAACARTADNDGSLAGGKQSGDGKAVLEVKVPVGKTKLPSMEGDQTVNNLQVFVFREDGFLDNYGKSSGSGLSLTCTTGNKNIYALVNAPDVSDVGNEAELNARVSLLKDNTAKGLVMSGKKTVNIRATQSVSVEVKRLAARICLKSFKNAIQMPGYKDLPIVVKAAYLLNVSEGIRYMEDVTNGSWINFKKCIDKHPLLYEDLSASSSLAVGSSLEGLHYFYCYPNTTAADATDEGSARFTRLVVEAMIGDRTFYYPVSIQSVKRNTAYNVSITVTRPGSDSPDIPVEKQDAQISVTVAEWEAGEDVTEII